MEEKQVVREFAESLIRLVRDDSIESCDRIVNHLTRGPEADRWAHAVADLPAGDAVKLVIPDIVDQVLFHLLDAIDNGLMPLGWELQDGACVSLSQAGHGEMGGWLMSGKGGWLDRFSKQRYFDYLADLP